MGTVPTFTSFTAGENPTAAKLNQHVTGGNFFRSPPVCVLSTTVAQSIPNNTQTLMSLDTTVTDTDAMADLANNRIVIKTAGLYIVGASLGWVNNATGFRSTVITKNAVGGAAIALDLRGAHAWLNYATPVSEPVRLAVNDTIRLEGGQNSGGALSTRTSEKATTLWARWVGA